MITPIVNFSFLARIVLMCIALFGFCAHAVGQSKFYMAVTESPPDQSWPSGRPYLTVGMHPVSATTAKANACLPLESSTWDIESCLTTKTALSCGNGGYFAFADAMSYLSVPEYSPYGWMSNSPPMVKAYGAACGKGSDAAARKAAIASCETASTRKSIPVPAIKSRDDRNGDYHHNCQVFYSGFNDGLYQGETVDFQKVKAEAVKSGGFLTSTNIYCWGKSNPEFADACRR